MHSLNITENESIFNYRKTVILVKFSIKVHFNLIIKLPCQNVNLVDSVISGNSDTKIYHPNKQFLLIYTMKKMSNFCFTSNSRIRQNILKHWYLVFVGDPKLLKKVFILFF